jgi:hypothetical protein
MSTQTVDPVVLDFIAYCLASRWDSTALGEASFLTKSRDFDWDRFITASHLSRTSGLVYDCIHSESWIPDRIRTELHQVYLQSAVRHLRLTHGYSTLIQAFNTAGIEHIIVKGPVLTEIVYQNPALRPYTDLDLIIHRADLDKAETALSKLDYVPQKSETRMGLQKDFENEAAWGQSIGDLAFHIDLHWQAVDRLYREMPWLWENTTHWTLNDVPTKVLNTEARLLYLATHVILHHGQLRRDQALIWLYDIALLIQASDPNLNWHRLLTLAQISEMTLPLKAALKLVKDVWTLNIPDGVNQSLATTDTPSRKARAINLLTHQVSGHSDDKFWISVGSLPTWRQRIRYVIALAFPPWIWISQRYQITNPIRILLKYPSRWLRGLTGLATMISRMIFTGDR